jgi:hypothetical protein
MLRVINDLKKGSNKQTNKIKKSIEDFNKKFSKELEILKKK